MVKAAILRSPGTNCNNEADEALKMAGAETEQVHVNEFISGKKKLEGYDILVMPGGFSYGDYIASGTILANQLKAHLKNELDGFISSGRVVIGICNGFQVMVKLGMLPGDGMRATLTNNDSGRFECRWIKLDRSNESELTKGIAEMNVPVAHGEGKFVADADTIKKIEANGQVIFRYSSSAYPGNPNGSINDIAGISNKQGNVIGMMPHPERHLTCQNHPEWTRTNCKEGEGLQIFRNIVAYSRRRKNDRISIIPREN